MEGRGGGIGGGMGGGLLPWHEWEILPPEGSLPTAGIEAFYHRHTSSEPELRRYAKHRASLRSGVLVEEAQAGDIAGEIGLQLEREERWEEAERWHGADVAHQIRAMRRGAERKKEDLSIALSRRGHCIENMGELRRAAAAHVMQHEAAERALTQRDISREQKRALLRERQMALSRLGDLHAKHADSIETDADPDAEPADASPLAASCAQLLRARRAEAARNVGIEFHEQAIAAAHNLGEPIRLCKVSASSCARPVPPPSTLGHDYLLGCP